MKILIVNTYDRGGAANACLRLHEGLLQQGIESKVLLKIKQRDLPQTFAFRKKHRPKNRFQLLKKKSIIFLRVIGILKKNKLNREIEFQKARSSGLELFSFPSTSFDITESPLYLEADIINLHWVADFLDYESFFKKNTKPVVWTLHDMNPFTGGAHYVDCNFGMDDNGFPLSQEITDFECRISKENLILKQKVTKDIENLTIVTPSKWLQEEAKNSAVFKTKPVKYIPYGINIDLYKPQDKTVSRMEFNIPNDKKVILFVADSINNQRKGFEYLKKAFEKLDRTDVILCSVGNVEDEFDPNKNIRSLGTIKTEQLMSMAYSAADVFVIPSLMDNLPNTVLESLLCGTPVIGFPVGGILDMVQHGENGLLTAETSVNALVETIDFFLNSIDSFERLSIRVNAMRKYDLKIQAASYKKLFENILELQQS